MRYVNPTATSQHTHAEQNRVRPPLEVLYPRPTDSTTGDAEVDIIAVHGLGSNVDWSWTWKGGGERVNWLQDPDMLPAKVPRSRITVYNYESRWDKNAPKTRLQLCGEELVHSVHSFRGGPSRRPIVFIGHSLGGNVIVNALLYASDRKEYRYLSEATAGVILLGTPLRGTKWQLFVDSLAQLMGPAGSHRGITKDLEFDGLELQDRLHRFCRLRNTLSTPVSCFFELYDTDYGRRFGLSGVAKGMIVEEASACIPGLDRYALQADHLKINKYRGPTDRGFLSVSGVIVEMCANANDVVTRRQDHALKQKPDAGACLRDLFLTDPLDDRKALKRKKGDRAAGTCEWILGTEELTTWLASGHAGCPEGPSAQVLWLHGNPGTGKSTTAIFLTEELSKAFSATDGKTLAYFLCDSGFDTRKTATSVVRGLLLQLVQQHPQLLDYVLPKYNERGTKLFTSFDALWTIFMNVAADKYTGAKYCVIDALDECDQDSQDTLLRQLKETFQSQNAPTNVRILVTSRLYPEIRRHMGEFANRDLASYPEAKQDIEQCIEERTTHLARTKYYTAKVQTQVSNILREKADGTFLWVGLACKELEDIPSKDAVRVLEGIPRGLTYLYKRLLDTAFEHRTGTDGLRRILNCVAVCVRPLSVLELSEASELHLDEDDEQTRIQFTRDQIESCRLMVVIQEEKVLLLHQSVKDFLTGPEAGHFINDLKAHADLAYRCVDLLIERFRNENDSSSPLLGYAIEQWPNHGSMAQTEFEVKEWQAGFFTIRSQYRQKWLELYSADYPDHSMGARSSILHVAVEWGIPALVEHVSRSDDENLDAGGMVELIHREDGWNRTPMEQAAALWHPKVMSLLLDLGGEVSAKVLEAAAGNEENGKEVTKLLLDQRGDQITITEEVVEAAAGNIWNGKEVMTLLLDRRGDQITITEKVVKAAAGNAWHGKEVMTLLLDRRGDQITITEEVVEAAAGNEEIGEEVIKLLLDQRGEQITITEKVVKAAAGNAWHGKEVMTLLLDRRGDQITITEEVVSIIAREFDEEVMTLLLDRRGEQITITEEVVKAAAGNRGSGKEVMTLLLDRRGNQITITEEVFDEEVMTLLLDRRGEQITITEVVKAAAGNWSSGKEIMALLLDRRGDQITITEEVVKAAAENWRSGKEVIALLLDRRGDQITITEEVVSIIAREFDEEVMTLLLDRRGEQITITEEVVKAAAGNWRSGKEVMALLLDRRGDQITITEEVVKAAAGNEGNGKEVMALLLDRRGEQITITEKVVKAAAGNWRSGKEVMALLLDRRGDQITIIEEVEVMTLLLDRRGDQITITEEVVKAAAGNEGNGKEVMTLLLDRRGDQITITEEVVKAAAENEESGKDIMELLLERRGNQITVTEEVETGAVAKKSWHYFSTGVATRSPSLRKFGWPPRESPPNLFKGEAATKNIHVDDKRKETVIDRIP
ncbi:ankyrin domain protein [Colletotrichum tofieldiae]|nr:ankyrin domain protein [Colletotrichum tofieldiae]